MARRIPEKRLQDLIDCAARVFIERGYRQTQMEEIASALGVAKGTLYLYVESKAALFDAVLRYAGKPLDAPPQLPIATPRSGATLAHVRDEIERKEFLPTLTQARRPAARDGRVELEGIVRQLYRALSGERVRIRLIDKSARDFPDIAALWFERVRRGTVALLRRYLEARVREGALRPVHEPAVTARLMLETIFHWAVDRHWDPHPTQVIHEAAAESALVDFIVAALARPVAAGRRKRTRPRATRASGRQ
ncbi:MAG TPA: helix-turn-helix domain-containing protein [Candidatus Binatia bacterium]